MQKKKTQGPFLRGLSLVCISLLLAACGSSAGRHLGSGGGTPPPPPPPPTSIAVSGIVTFDRVPFAAAVGAGLDFAATQAVPARGVTVEAVSATDNSVITSVPTSATGAYSLTLSPNTNVFLRVKAEMVKTGSPSWAFHVRDNTSGNALYALDGAVFDTGAKATLSRNLHAASGWNASSNSYPDPALRTAAPFALLDDIYDSIQLVLSADANAAFPPLNVFWSPNNIPNDGVGDPAVDFPAGNIGTTFFEAGAPASLYVLGAADADTDEFDAHVIAHEWGHYYQFVFSRDDSVGGDHLPSERLDMRVAFSEGWGDAFSGMALNDPVYRDSFDIGQAADFGADMESGTTPAPGWFSEGSVALILYDLFDGPDAEAESVQLGFGPIHAAMGALSATAAFTGIHPFINALVPFVSASEATAIQTLVTAQNIVGVQPDDFAPLELNDGGDADTLPIYTAIAPGSTATVCSDGAPGRSYNKLGNRSFLRLTLAAPYSGSIAVTTSDAISDADVILYDHGVEIGRHEDPGDDLLPVDLQAGTYVIETYESSNVFGDFVNPPPFGPICIDVTVAP